MTEDELWSILHKTNIEHGGEWIECRILSSGERTNPWMQESSNKIIQSGEIVSFDTDMVGPYGYCADISRAFVEGNKFNDEQKKLYSMAVDQINHIHHRQPVLLEESEITSFLLGKDIFNSNANNNINFYRVSMDVNNPKNNNSSLTDIY